MDSKEGNTFNAKPRVKVIISNVHDCDLILQGSRQVNNSTIKELAKIYFGSAFLAMLFCHIVLLAIAQEEVCNYKNMNFSCYFCHQHLAISIIMNGLFCFL